LQLAYKEYCAKNPEKARVRSARYARRNKEKVSERYAKWYAKNAEHKRRYARKLHWENREQKNAYSRRYAQENREKKRAYLNEYRKTRRSYFVAHENNRRALKLAAGGEWTKDDIACQKIIQNGRCYYCCAELSANFHADHIVPLIKGGSNHTDNLAIACRFCNCSKRDKLAMDFVLGLLK
jgi:hypothetical protein